MATLLATLSHLHEANVKTNKLLPFSEQNFRKLEPWPEPKLIPVRNLKAFTRLDVRPSEAQLSQAAGIQRCNDVGPVIVNDDSEVLFGQLRVAALRERFRGKWARVPAVKFSELTEKQLAFLVRQAFSLIYSPGWDHQMLSIDCQGLSALVSKTGAAVPTRARPRLVAHHPTAGVAAN